GQRGGTLFGFLAGLVLGLGIAVVVALFVTRAPVPFVKKSHRAPEAVTAPRNGEAMPDPNAPLGSRMREGDGTAPAVAQPPQPAPQAPAPGAPAAPSAQQAAPAADGFLLQAGAFRS